MDCTEGMLHREDWWGNEAVAAIRAGGPLVSPSPLPKASVRIEGGPGAPEGDVSPGDWDESLPFHFARHCPAVHSPSRTRGVIHDSRLGHIEGQRFAGFGAEAEGHAPVGRVAPQKDRGTSFMDELDGLDHTGQVDQSVVREGYPHIQIRRGNPDDPLFRRSTGQSPRLG